MVADAYSKRQKIRPSTPCCKYPEMWKLRLKIRGVSKLTHDMSIVMTDQSSKARHDRDGVFEGELRYQSGG